MISNNGKSRKNMDEKPTIAARFLIFMVTAGMMLLSSCEINKQPTPPYDIPRNIWITINHDSAATRDTVLRVSIVGENVNQMQISGTPDLHDTPWEPFDTLKLVHAPRVEGVFSVYGRFASLSNAYTGIIHDDIVIDLSANIISLEIDAPDEILQPQDSLVISMNTDEKGDAEISLGSLVRGFKLTWRYGGRFSRTLVLPNLLSDEIASVTGRFTDEVGNIADSLVFDQLFILRGPALNPIVIARIPTGGISGDDIWYHQGFCYISAMRNVYIINVQDPDRPLHEGSLPTPDWNHGMHATRRLLLVSANDADLLVYSITQPRQPIRLGQARDLWGQTRDVVIDTTHSFAYVSCHFSGLHVVDMLTPESPDVVANVRTNIAGDAIAVNDTIVYITGVGGLATIDVSNPREPEHLADLVDFTDQPRELIYFEDEVFISMWDEGIARVSVRNPRDPRIMQVYPHLDNATGMALSYPYLFVSRQDKVSIVNISDTQRLPVIANIPGMNHAVSVCLNENYLFIAEDDEMTIVDLAPLE